MPDKVIGDHVACYNVMYKGKHIAPKAASQMRIPLGQVWISDKWKKHEKVILYHELQEIKYQYEGHTIGDAHRMARRDEKRFLEGR